MLAVGLAKFAAGLAKFAAGLAKFAAGLALFSAALTLFAAGLAVFGDNPTEQARRVIRRNHCLILRHWPPKVVTTCTFQND